SHEKIFTQKEVQFAGGEDAVFAAVIDTMNDNEQIGREFIIILGDVFVHFGRGADHDAIFNREGMKMEQVFEDDLRLLGRGVFEIDPEEKVGVAEQRWHQERIDVPGMQTALGSKCE